MTLRAGSASVDVTPNGSVPMSGYGTRDEPSTGMHDPLLAGALVLDDGATAVGVVSVDLLNVSRPLTSAVEDRLADEGIHLDELVLAATHTHGGPYVPAPVLDIHPTLSVEEDVSSVVDGLARGIADAVATAHERLEPATVRAGTAADDGTIRNRRADLGARLPATDVDREVVALLIEGASGAEAILFNLACHPVCTTGANTLLTADWPGVTRREVAAARPGEPTVLFCNGAAGELNPRDRSGVSRSVEESFEYVEGVGAELAAPVLEAVDDAEAARPHDHGPILAERRELRLPVRTTPDVEALEEKVADLRATRDRLREDGHDAAAARYGNDLTALDELRAIADWNARHLPARLQYVQVGPLGVLSFPGEVFVRHGLDFKAAADVDTLLAVGYASDYPGYIPTLSELENRGYEVWTAKVAPEAIVEFRNAGLDLVSARGSATPTG